MPRSAESESCSVTGGALALKPSWPGLREFLAACGVRGTSCGTPPCGGVSHEQGGAPHEVVGESPRRIILDIANISEHEKAAGANFANLKLHLSICVRRKDIPLVFETSSI